MTQEERTSRPHRDIPDHPEEECAVFGVFCASGTADGTAANAAGNAAAANANAAGNTATSAAAATNAAANLAYFGLHALQHRGQESAGIAVADGTEVVATKDMGLVTQVFDENSLAALTGHVAIGHTRYSTSGGATAWDAAQPHLSTIGDEIIALAHNGTLVNTTALRGQLLDLGIGFRSNTDSEVAAKLIGYFTKETHHMREGIRRTMEMIEGAYAMVLITNSALYAFRDPNGIRPLSIGKLPDDQGWVVSSETCGLDIVGAQFVRDVEPGEVIRIKSCTADGLVAEQALPKRKRALCIFEYVYFARPDSVLDGQGVYEARTCMGRKLAQEAPVEADCVIGVPDSGVPSAIGYAIESGIPYVEGIVKNRYVGRTFIQPTQMLRQRGIRLKLNPLPVTIAGKRIIVVDDSIVRGNTSRQLVTMLRDAGATEVHMRVVSPPVVWPCFYGIDTDTQDQLIAANLTVEQIAAHIGVDSLAYITTEGLESCVHARTPGYCTACFSGSYPIKVTEQMSANSFCDTMEPEWWPQESHGTPSLF